jgi:hypothetical protein
MPWPNDGFFDRVRLHGLHIVESRDHPDVRTGSVDGEPITQLGIDLGQSVSRARAERLER